MSTRRGAKLKMFGGTAGLPIIKNKLFSFSSYEQWDDNRPLTIVRTVPTALERAGDFSQSLLSGRVRTIYNPFTSVRTREAARGAHALRRQRDSLVDDRPGVPEDPAGDADAQPPGQPGQPPVRRLRQDRLLELLRARGLEHHGQLEDLRPLRAVQGEPLPAESDRRRLLPLAGSNHMA
jgi:hypothetical protein